MTLVKVFTIISKLFLFPDSSTGLETRVMVFCQYRDSVREITELLQTHRPLIRPMQFVGHAPSTNPVDEKSSGKNNRRFTQKDQLMVIEYFKNYFVWKHYLNILTAK